jgi:4-amino-4-deoxy-L-arabinose transferase-like glycosyltransferase
MALHQTLALQIHDAVTAGHTPSLAGYYPPLYHTIVAGFYSAFGKTVDAAQWANLPAIALLLISTYAAGRRVLDPLPAAAAAALVSFYPLMLWLSRETLIDYWLTSMVAFAMWVLLRTRDFSDRTRAIQFGLVCGLGMLTKWTFVFFLAFPTLWIARKSPRNFAVAAGVAAVVAGFWYLEAASMLVQFMKINQVGAVNEGDPARLGFQAVVFYIRTLEGYQLFLPLFLVFLLGAILLARNFDAAWMPVLLWLASGWLGLLLFQNKDPRYSAPLLPAIALITARVFQKREAWIFALAPVLLFQHYLVSFGVPQLPGTVVLAQGVEGPLSWNWNLYTQRYFNLWGPPAAEDWKIEHVLETVSNRDGQPVRITMIPDIPRFDTQAFQFYAALRQLPVTVTRLATLDESALAGSDYILASSKDVGFEAGSAFTEDLKSINHFIAVRPDAFPVKETFRLPNGDTIRLYRVRKT